MCWCICVELSQSPYTCIKKSVKLIQEHGEVNKKLQIFLSLLFVNVVMSGIGFIPFDFNLNMNDSYQLLVKMCLPQEDVVTKMNILLLLSKLVGFRHFMSAMINMYKISVKFGFGHMLKST